MIFRNCRLYLRPFAVLYCSFSLKVLEDGELEGLLADQKQDLQSLLAAMPGTNYHPIWIPVESVRERKEAALAAIKEKQEKEEEMKKQAEESAASTKVGFCSLPVKKLCRIGSQSCMTIFLEN
jgi:hypothetical protein